MESFLTRRVVVVVASIVMVASLSVTAASASAGSVTESRSSVIRACEDPVVPGSPHLAAGASLEMTIMNMGRYPFGYGATSDLGVFARGHSLDACLAAFTHLRAEGSASLIVESTPRVTTSKPFSGVAGVLRGGYSANRDLDTLTVWVAGVVAPQVTGVTLEVDYSEPCKNDPTCPGPLITAGRSPALLHGRYFAASMVVKYSAPRANFTTLLTWRTAKGPSRVSLGVEDFATPLARDSSNTGF